MTEIWTFEQETTATDTSTTLSTEVYGGYYPSKSNPPKMNWREIIEQVIVNGELPQVRQDKDARTH